jgi:hypothetical protein
VTDLPPADEADLFDEAGYLRLYPGIAEAIQRGAVTSAHSHYHHHGRAEGRWPNDVDPAFYLSAYPAIAEDLGRDPAADDAARHYIGLGRARGYRPNAAAPRAANGAAQLSPFGGFWTDQGDALDLIAARARLARVRPWEARLLRHFALDGYAAFDRPADKEKMEAAALVIEQAFSGRWPVSRFVTSEADPAPRPWDPELVAEPALLLDPHMLSADVRAILLDPQLLEFLTHIFDAPPRLTASRGALRASAGPERDVAWFPHSLPLRFLAVTVCLEERTTDLTSVWPGSHHLPDLPFPDESPDPLSARQAGEFDPARRASAIERLIQGRLTAAFEMRFTDRVIRHGNLIHMIRPPEPPSRHRMLTAWYCPDHVMPGYVERGGARMHQRDGISFLSGAYPDMDPMD